MKVHRTQRNAMFPIHGELVQRPPRKPKECTRGMWTHVGKAPAYLGFGRPAQSSAGQQ